MARRGGETQPGLPAPGPARSTIVRAGLVGLLVVVPLVAGSAPALFAQGMRQPPAISRTPPFDLKDEAAVDSGRRLFQQYCTGYCHGREGRVSRAPKLRGRQFDSVYLYGRIANGFPPMPAFQTLLPAEDIWKLVAYIVSLEDVKED